MLQPITASTLSAIDGIRHGFFGRQGGVSSGLYTSLNCGLGSSDDRAAVIENRRRVAQSLTAKDAVVVTVFQVHSAEALVVDRPFAVGETPKADALVTQTPGLVIGALAADCTPVLFVDPATRTIGAAHAGWRGALSGVLEATIVAMSSLGAAPHRIRAAIGPTINQRSYEVGTEFEADLLAKDATAARHFQRFAADGRPHFDLPGYVEARLRRAGLASVERQTRCTYANPDALFSYRRATHHKDSDYGRQISAIVVT